MTSVGSGALIGLTLILLYKLDPRRVVGTDVFHAAVLLWTAGLAHFASGNVDLGLMATILIGSLPGVWIGTALVPHVPVVGLRYGLGVVLAAASLGRALQGRRPGLAGHHRRRAAPPRPRLARRPPPARRTAGPAAARRAPRSAAGPAGRRLVSARERATSRGRFQVSAHRTRRTTSPPPGPTSSPAPPMSPRIARDVAARLRDRRHAAARRHRRGPGVVGGQGERHGREAAQQVAHQVRLGVDRRARVERVAEPVRARRARHELRDPARAGRAHRERVEARLDVQLGGQQRRRDVPALRGTGEQRGEARRDEPRHAAPAGTVRAGRGRGPRHSGRSRSARVHADSAG